MGLASSFYAFMVLFHLVLLLLLLHLAEAAAEDEPSCPLSFDCGKHGPISFPFANNTYSECGQVVNCDDDHQFPGITLGGRQYDVVARNQWSLKEGTIILHDPELQKQINSENCSYLHNFTLPNFPSTSFTLRFDNLTMFKCAEHPKFEQQIDANFSGYHYRYTKCSGHILYYNYPNNHAPIPSPLPDNCSVIQMLMKPPLHEYRNPKLVFDLLGAEFSLEVNVSDACNVCQKRGGRCPHENENNLHWCGSKEGKHLGLILGTAIPGAVLLLVCLLICITWRSKKWSSLHFFSRINSSGPSSKEDIEGGIVFFGVPVFPYGELEEATKNFHPSKELGDGGFGIVYHGKLRDGREVAVKRLYEKNYKQVQQFINEIEILTCLRHRNLVTLYGCTSRHSRELLLVYEYIPNGTVADHIHGDRAKPGSPLTWPIRMNIALETASALTYLHASEIIHRDVKTNNILLDNNFCVKVADFGLSRLYPNDVSHISTAPQGTPGYVDPDYHKCYQLTNKSDVYSFGVVLIELISSMPAVDMKRHWDEINLADLAINRIQNCALDELVDPSLGFESDAMVNKMITAVAELAFQCLQHEKEFRPTMNEVLEALKEIKGEECQEEKTGDVGALKTTQPPPAPKSDGVLLLKYIEQHPSQGLVGLTHPTPVALAEPPFHSV